MKDLVTIFLLAFSLSLVSCGGEAKEEADVKAAPAKKDPTEEPIPDLPKREFVLGKDKGFLNPESVTSDGTYYYVSNLGKELKPFRKDQDGFIMQLDSAGNVVNKKWASGLDAPKGMVIVGNTLYVTDIDRIKAYDLSTRKRTDVLDLSKDFETPFLNDLEVKNDKELFVSATNLQKVLLVKLGEKMTYEDLGVHVPNPNGLVYLPEENILYVNSYDQYGGYLGRIDFPAEGATYTQEGDDYKGELDGLAYVRGKLIYTDWTQSLLRMYAPTLKTGGYYPLKKRISGPADMYYDKGRNELWIPAMQEGQVYVMFVGI